jgi:nucleoside-diphosphate-sugar epimerase
VVDRKNVLITGSSGLIGTVLRNGLGQKYNLSGVDIRPSVEFKCLQADMTNLQAISPAFKGIDTVIDLAAQAENTTEWPRVYENNLPSTYNALEAARRAGVKRLIFASSNHVTGMYEGDHPYSSIVKGNYKGLNPPTIPHITANMPIRPDGPYGIGKAFGESAGRYYSDKFELSVICIRIGSLVKESRPNNIRHFSTLFTHEDLVQMVDLCISSPDSLKFDIFYGVSGNTWRIWDISHARDVLGYEPTSNTDTWR